MKYFFLIGLLATQLYAQAPDETRFPTHVASCQVGCQHWNVYTGTCYYNTSCTFNANEVDYKYCEVWDTFGHRCVSELVSHMPYQLNSALPLPACMERCQQFAINGTCLYRTKCQYDGALLTNTVCGVWNSLDQVCQYETNIYEWTVEN